MIDLHLHTNHSDGTDSVEELLRNAENKKLDLISITDHDQVGAYYELENNSNLRSLYNGKIVVGSELKTCYDRVPIEILAYGIDYKKIRIHEIDMQKMQEEIMEKLKSVARSLGLKFDEKNTYIDRKDSMKQFAAFTLGTELLKHEENKEIIKQIGEFEPTTFFRVHQSNLDSPFYADETFASIDINELIYRIHEAGGLAFLAHGFIYPFKDRVKTIEEILSKTEIDGMECIYPLFSEEERKIAFDLCKKYNKYMSGGSDYHAKNKPNVEMGTGIDNNISIDLELVKDWIDKVRKV
ncbi:MAG: PHP domain-containing protein [Clostridia bacterium]|nr:PHP domain-containing protein [Clostridia bacterium]